MAPLIGPMFVVLLLVFSDAAVSGLAAFSHLV